MITKKIYSLVLVVLVGVGLLVFANFFRDRKTSDKNPSPSVSGQPVPDASISPTNTGTTPNPDASFPAGISKLVPTCSIGGEIVFAQPKLAQIKDAYFRYDLVTDSHDIMKWVMTPSEENVNIGPNRFGGLSLPKGKETIIVGFENPAKQKQYKLKASIDYPYWVNGAVKVLNKECSGETVVNVTY